MSSTVAKALTLLEHFSEDEAEIALSELARRSGIDKSAVHRMLGAMAESGLVEQRPDTRLYRLGAGVLRLARVREKAFPVHAVVQQVLNALSEKTGETAHASLISGRAMANIGTCESKRGSRVSLVAGEVGPFHSTASGLSVLAFGDKKLAKRVLSGILEPKTKFTLTDAAELEAKISSIQELGFSESNHTNEEGVHGLAAPVFDRSGLACGAVSVSTPSQRVTEESRLASIPVVINSARLITEGTGGQVPPAYAQLVHPFIQKDL